MSLQAFIFYVVAAMIVASTAVAVTRRNLVHAVVYLIFSFLGTAMLFYLFGAPLLAALEVIIYAGAIMVLFLFIVMMIKMESHQELMFPLPQWIPAAIFGMVYLLVFFLMTLETPGTGVDLPMAMASPRELSIYLFQKHWLSIEIVSLLLLVALIGALNLGRGKSREEDDQ